MGIDKKIVRSILESITIGLIMGGLYCLTLWVSLDSLKMASFILYGNPYYLPLCTTGIIMGISFVVLFTYQYWEKYTLYIMYYIVDQLKQGR